MAQATFPPLPLAEWQESRDTIHRYSQVLGKIRQALTPKQKHWWHICLRANVMGLTTTPIPAGDQTFDITLNLLDHLAEVRTSCGEEWDLVLEGQPVNVFCRDTLDALSDLDIHPNIDRTDFDADTNPRVYEDVHVENYWQALSQIDVLMKQFKGTFRGESSPVNLWAHHFDLSLVWFSGRLVPDQDPNDPDQADEHMAFGFSTGDEGIPDPYFYITAYPWPAGLEETTLPAGAQWQTAGWQGALLMYDKLQDCADPKDMLLTYWQTLHTAGAKLMTG